MMIAETTVQVHQGPLQEPLLIHQTLSGDEIGQGARRRAAKGPIIVPLDVSEQQEPEQNERFRIENFKKIILLVQFAWPALLLSTGAFDGHDMLENYHEWFFFLVILLPLLIFMSLVVFDLENTIHEFRFRDFAPTLAWLVFPLLSEEVGRAMLLSAVILLARLLIILLTILLAIKRYKQRISETTNKICQYLYYNICVRLSNQINFYKDMEEEFFEHLQEQEAAEQEQLEAQIKALSQLEEVSPRRTPPVCCQVSFVLVFMWTLGFLVFDVFDIFLWRRER